MEKGNVVGILVFVAVAIIMGLVIMQSISQYIGTSTTSGVYTNKSVLLSANGTILDVDGAQKGITIEVYNDTSLIGTDNVSVSNRVGNDGLITLSIQSVGVGRYASQRVNISGTYEPDGYISSSGARSVTLLILIMVGLCIAVISLIPTLRNGFIDMVS